MAEPTPISETFTTPGTTYTVPTGRHAVVNFNHGISGASISLNGGLIYDAGGSANRVGPERSFVFTSGQTITGTASAGARLHMSGFLYDNPA